MLKAKNVSSIPVYLFFFPGKPISILKGNGKPAYKKGLREWWRDDNTWKWRVCEKIINY